MKIIKSITSLMFAVLSFATFGETPAATPTKCVIIAPNDYLSVWQWYAQRRMELEPNTDFTVVNANGIYTQFPKPTYRNPAESVHAFIRAQAAQGVGNFILGGVWINAQNLNEAGESLDGSYLRTGPESVTRLSLANAIPGIMTWPQQSEGNNWWFGGFPSDCFFACTNTLNGASTWDANGNGWYCDLGEVDDARCDFSPDVVVSRMSFKPWEYAERPGAVPQFRTFEQLVTNYIQKLERGISHRWSGNGCAAAVVGTIQEAGDYDAMAKKRMEETYSAYRQPRNLCYAIESQGTPLPDVFNMDRDFVFYAAHGNGDSVLHITPDTFTAGCAGLTMFIGGNISCFSGNVNAIRGKTIGGTEYFCVAPTIGEGAISAIGGGALFSINNSFYGYLAEESFSGLRSGISDEMLTYATEAFFRDAQSAGESWRRGIANYAAVVAAGTLRDDIKFVRSAMLEEICFGDPLIYMNNAKPSALVLRMFEHGK